MTVFRAEALRRLKVHQLLKTHKAINPSLPFPPALFS